MISVFWSCLLLDALLTGASESFWKLASTPRADCTKHLLRVCLRPFRDGDCEGFPSRPRISSRTFRRRFKVTARPRWRSWAKGDSAPWGTNLGEAPPVGVVSTFRSADGQPAVRKQATCIVLFSASRVTVRSCNQTVEVGICGVGVHRGINVPQVAMSCSTRRTLVPSLPQLGACTDRTGRPCIR